MPVRYPLTDTFRYGWMVNGLHRTGVEMNGMRWLGRIVVAAAAALTTALAGTYPASAAAGSGGPQLLAIAPPVITAQTPTWITGHWLTTQAVCDFRLTASGSHVQVTYPSNTGSYTSFYRGDWLAAMQADYTAFKVSADAVTGVVPLRLELSYVEPDGAYRPGGRCAGAQVIRSVTMPLAVLTPPAGLTADQRR